PPVPQARTRKGPMHPNRASLTVYLCLFLSIAIVCFLEPFVGSSQIPVGPWSLKLRGAVIREATEWYYRQRAYPLRRVPPGAQLRAFDELDRKIGAERAKAQQIPPTLSGAGPRWSPAGPLPTSTSSQDPTVSGEITTLAIDPQNSGTVYAGTAQA